MPSATADINWDAVADEYGLSDGQQKAAASQPAGDVDWDKVGAEFGLEEIKPQGLLGTAGTAMKRYLPSSLAAGGAGILGGAAGAALGPAGAVAGDITAGTAAGYGAEKFRESLSNERDLAKEKAQIEVNQAANPFTSTVATMAAQIPAFAGGGTGIFREGKAVAEAAGKTFTPTVLQAVAESAKGGARMSGASTAAAEVEVKQDLNPSEIAQEIAKGAITMGPLGFISKVPGLAAAATDGIAKTVARQAGHALTAGEVLAHSNALYESATGKQPYDETEVLKRGLADAPGFFALGMGTHLLHSGAGSLVSKATGGKDETDQAVSDLRQRTMNDAAALNDAGIPTSKTIDATNAVIAGSEDGKIEAAGADHAAEDFTNANPAPVEPLEGQEPSNPPEATEITPEALEAKEPTITPNEGETPQNESQSTASVEVGKETISVSPRRVQELMDNGMSKYDAMMQAKNEANPLSGQKPTTKPNESKPTVGQDENNRQDNLNQTGNGSIQPPEPIEKAKAETEKIVNEQTTKNEPAAAEKASAEATLESGNVTPPSKEGSGSGQEVTPEVQRWHDSFQETLNKIKPSDTNKARKNHIKLVRERLKAPDASDDEKAAAKMFLENRNDAGTWRPEGWGMTNTDVAQLVNKNGFVASDVFDHAAKLIKNGVKSLANWSRGMVMKFGKGIKDFLKDVWSAMKGNSGTLGGKADTSKLEDQSTKGEKYGPLKAVRDKDFASNRVYHVETSNGDKIRIFKDQDSTNWYEDDRRPNGTYPLLSTGTMQEALDKIVREYGHDPDEIRQPQSTDALKADAIKEISSAPDYYKTIKLITSESERDQKTAKRLYDKYKTDEPSMRGDAMRRELADLVKSKLGIDLKIEDRPTPDRGFDRNVPMQEFLPEISDWLKLGRIERSLDGAPKMGGVDAIDVIGTERENTTGANALDLDAGFRNQKRQELLDRVELVKRLEEQTKGLYSQTEIIKLAEQIHDKAIQSTYADDTDAATNEGNKRFIRLYDAIHTPQSTEGTVRYSRASEAEPQSERFNPESKDIRYSSVEVDPNQNKALESDAMPENATEEEINKWLEIYGIAVPEKLRTVKIVNMFKSAHANNARDVDGKSQNNLINHILGKGGVTKYDAARIIDWIKDVAKKRALLDAKYQDNPPGRMSREDYEAGLNPEGELLDAQMDRLVRARNIAANHGGSILRYLRASFIENYSAESLTKGMVRSNGGKELSPAQKRFVDRLAAEAKNIDAGEAKNGDEIIKDNVDYAEKAAKKMHEPGGNVLNPAQSTDRVQSSIDQARGFLGRWGYKEGGKIEVVHDEKPVMGVNSEGKPIKKQWFARYHEGKIELNAANIPDQKSFNRQFAHELTHAALDKFPELKATAKKILKGMTDAEKTEIDKHLKGHKKAEHEDESYAKAVELIMARKDTKVDKLMKISLRKIMDGVKRFVRGLLGKKTTDDQIHDLTGRILAHARESFEDNVMSNNERNNFAKGRYSSAELPDGGYKFNPEATRKKLEDLINNHPEGEPISDAILERAMALAGHERVTHPDSNKMSFNEHVGRIIEDAGNKDVTHEFDTSSSMERWISERLQTKQDKVNRIGQLGQQRDESKEDTDVTTLTRQIEKLESDIKDGNFIKESAKRKELSAEATKLQRQRDILKHEYTSAKYDAAQGNQPLIYRGLDNLARFKRFNILQSPMSSARLVFAALGAAVKMPFEDTIGAGIAGILPKSIGSKATIEGRNSMKSISMGIARGVTRGFVDAKSNLTKGHSELDAQLGKIYPHGGIFSIPGRMHAFIKAPLKRMAFEVAMQRQIEGQMEENVRKGYGSDVLPTPEQLFKFQVNAYEHAQRQIFMNDTKTGQAIHKLISELDRGGDIGKVTATLIRLVMPIVKVPINIAKEAFTYVGGVPAGLINIVKAYSKGIEKLSEEEANMIVRQLKKGSVGGAFMLLGYLNPQIAGGYYQQGDNKNPRTNDAKVGQLRINGWDVPKWASHIPLIEAIHFGSTIRRVSEQHGTDGLKGLSAGAGAAGWGITKELPYIDQMLRLHDLESEKGREHWLGDLAKSTVTPTALEFVAKQGDIDPRTGEVRKVQANTPKEMVQSIIPGQRNKLQTKYQ